MFSINIICPQFLVNGATDYDADDLEGAIYKFESSHPQTPQHFWDAVRSLDKEVYFWTDSYTMPKEGLLKVKFPSAKPGGSIDAHTCNSELRLPAAEFDLPMMKAAIAVAINTAKEKMYNMP